MDTFEEVLRELVSEGLSAEHEDVVIKALCDCLGDCISVNANGNKHRVDELVIASEHRILTRAVASMSWLMNKKKRGV